VKNTVGCNLEETTNMYKKACSRGNHNSFGGESLRNCTHFAYQSCSRQLDDQGNERR
jgi:hypothetical protein